MAGQLRLSFVFGLVLYCLLGEMAIVEVNGKAPVDCSYFSILNASHFVEMPKLPRTATIQKNDKMYCRFKTSCCSDAVLYQMRGTFLVSDYVYAAAEFIQERIRERPEDGVALILDWISRSIPQAFADIEMHPKVMKVFQSALVVLDKAAYILEDRFYTLWSSYNGYMSGLLCLHCMPTSGSFFTTNVGNTEAALLLKPEACDEISGKFVLFLDSVAAFLQSKVVLKNIEKIYDAICKSVPGCEEDAVNSRLSKMLQTLNRDTLRTAICGGVEACDEFVCVHSLHGLGFSMKKLSENIISYAESSCEGPCRDSSFVAMIEQLKQLGNEKTTTDDISIHNEYPSKGGFDVYKLGCASGLSDHACSKANVAKDTKPKPPRGSGIGTFFLVVLILGALGTGAYFVYKKNKEEPLNLYSSLN